MDTKAYIAKGSYDKRLQFLKSKWEELMNLQDKSSHETIASVSFQNKRKRIGRLYNIVNAEMMRERKDAARWALESVSPGRTNNMVNLPKGKICFNF